MVSIDLLRAIRRTPDLLYSISPREFEELVAEVLAGLDWEVSLTPSTKDGGHDILAVVRTAGDVEVRIIVECKRYGADHSVGIPAVQKLLGVKQYIGATKALLVTTSQFTADAQRLAQDHSFEIELIDRNKLLAWLSTYLSMPLKAARLPHRGFESCFISHSHKDHEFASLLNARLQSAGVRVWFAPEHMHAGEKMKDQIDRAIMAFDRIVAVVSHASIASSWVTTELTQALKRELAEAHRVLFPVSLIAYSELQAWESFNADLGRDVAAAVREYHVLDFSEWHDTESFDVQFAKLLKGLDRAPAA
jgi:hypothetical protein